MSTPPPADRAALGRARLAERARRVSRIRRRVVAATVAAFVLAWGVVAFDGSMGATTLASTSSSATTGSTTSSSDTTSSSSDSSSSSSDSSSSSADAPAAVTTSQS